MVSYLNSKPFILGMELANLLDDVELHLEVPAKTAEKLQTGDVDVALVPVAILPTIPKHTIITDYCIGANGQVDSVFLFSQVPIQEVETIYLDSHSRTSSKLVQILCKEYWKQDVQFIENTIVHQNLVQGTTACLMIGDKAIHGKQNYKYNYDLAQVWKQHTGLPFAFAVWISTTPISQNWEKRLNEAFELGLQNIPKISPTYQRQFPNFDIHHYLTNNIQFEFTAEKAKALDLFLRKIEHLQANQQPNKI